MPVIRIKDSNTQRVGMVKLIASKRYENPGVIPPERVGERAELFEHMLSELEARGVNCTGRFECV